MNIALPYGNTMVTAEIPWARHLNTLEVDDAPALIDLHGALHVQTNTHIRTVKHRQTVAIIVSDAFRNTGVEVYLPALLEILRERGVIPEDISFLFSTGTHRHPTVAEQERILGAAVYEDYKSRCHIGPAS